jgi:hypothetical protein
MEEREATEAAVDRWWAPGPNDLLIEGEEREYFLELLMRATPPGEPNPASNKTNPPARKEEGSEGKTASTRGKGKKKDKKKAPKGGDGTAIRPKEKEISPQREEESVAGQSGKQARTRPPDPLINPEAEGRGLAGRSQMETGPGARPTTTSRGECSGQEKPDS